MTASAMPAPLPPSPRQLETGNRTLDTCPSPVNAALPIGRRTPPTAPRPKSGADALVGSVAPHPRDV